MNISNNLLKCPICKNVFFKNLINHHYQLCKKRRDDLNASKENVEINKQKHHSIKNSRNIPYNMNKGVHQNTNIVDNRRYDNSEKENTYELRLESYIPPQLVTYNDKTLNHFFKEYEKLFISFIQDKCIALVGPAQSIIGTGKGNIIDKFDLVVRLNKSIPLPQNISNDIGERTDIIYNSLNTSDFPGQNNLNPKLYKKYGVKYVCSSYPYNHKIFHDDILNYVVNYKFELPLKVMNDIKFRNFENLLGTRPYTGTCAIMDLLSYPIKYLYITGLDFYQTKYYSEYRRATKESLKNTKNSTIHQAKPQLDYLKNISLQDNRIILDAFLDKLLYHDYYKLVRHLKDINEKDIFSFGDKYFEKYFEMKMSNCTFTRNSYNINRNDDGSYLILTDSKYFNKNNNEYCIFVTNDNNLVNFLNIKMTQKKYIGNFYYNDNKANFPTIYLTTKFLNNLKALLNKVGITNCNVYLVILLSIMLYLPDKHYFSSNEIFNNWRLNNNEKKLVLFLSKKKILNLI